MRTRRNIPQSIKKRYQIEGDKGLIESLTNQEDFKNLILRYDFRLFLKKDLSNKITLEPFGEIKSVQQLEDYISILNLVKKYCD